MTRREDWPERLNEYIDAVRDTPFEWGVHDCCTFVADVVLAMTDEDAFAEFRGRYSDEAGALALMDGATLEQALEKIAAENGWEEVAPSYAQRGDILFLSDAIAGTSTAFGGFAGISNGPVAAHVIVQSGLIFTKISYASRAWRVE